MIFDEKYKPILGVQGLQHVEPAQPEVVVTQLPFGLPAGATAALLQLAREDRTGAYSFIGTNVTDDTYMLALAANEKVFLTNAAQIAALVVNAQRYVIQFFTGGQGSTS